MQTQLSSGLPRSLSAHRVLWDLHSSHRMQCSQKPLIADLSHSPTKVALNWRCKQRDTSTLPHLFSTSVMHTIKDLMRQQHWNLHLLHVVRVHNLGEGRSESSVAEDGQSPSVCLVFKPESFHHHLDEKDLEV